MMGGAPGSVKRDSRWCGTCPRPATMGVLSNQCREQSNVEFGFSEEQLMIQDVARRIAQEKIAPSAEEFDRSGEFPLDNIRLLGENGLMGIEVPAEYGGAGMDSIATVFGQIGRAHV